MAGVEYEVRYTYDADTPVDEAEVFARVKTLGEAVQAATKITGGPWRSILGVEGGYLRKLTRAENEAVRALYLEHGEQAHEPWEGEED